MKHAEIYFAIRNYMMIAGVFVSVLCVGYILIQYAKYKRREKKRNKKNP